LDFQYISKKKSDKAHFKEHILDVLSIFQVF